MARPKDPNQRQRDHYALWIDSELGKRFSAEYAYEGAGAIIERLLKLILAKNRTIRYLVGRNLLKY